MPQALFDHRICARPVPAADLPHHTPRLASVSGHSAVELEQPAETLRALDRPNARGCTPVDQLVADALMVSLVVEVHQILIDDSAQVTLAEQDHPAQALFLDGPNEALGVGVGERRQLQLMGNVRM